MLWALTNRIPSSANLYSASASPNYYWRSVAQHTNAVSIHTNAPFEHAAECKQRFGQAFGLVPWYSNSLSLTYANDVVQAICRLLQPDGASQSSSTSGDL